MKGDVMAARLALCALLAMAGGAAAQESWSDHTAAGEWAFSRGDMDRCEAEFRSALELAQAFPEGDRRLETSLSNLGRFYEHRGRWNEAQPLYLLLLAVQETRLGAEDPALLDALFAVARSSIPLGDAPSAEASLRRYLAIGERTGTGDRAQRWQAASVLARVLTLQDRQREAVEFQRLAVAAIADDGFASDLDRATQLETLAQLEISNGSAAGVEPLLDEVAELRKAGEEGGGAAATYASAAASALGAGELELAERLASKAIAAGDGEPELAVAHRVLADVSWLRVRRGSSELADLLAVDADPADLALATDRLKTLYALHDDTWGAGDPDRIEILSRLAQSTAMAGDLEAAARWQGLYAKSVADQGGERALVAIDGLAYLLTETGRFGEAIEVNTRLLDLLAEAWADDDERLVGVLRRQELLLAELGRKKEAKAVRKRLRRLGG